ncbi:hypothetical protein BGX33_001373 [Mortierella sp. NVP41]|nr:hypothetical protein BGX33_001373 [Mortierella sp. NVP41]
MSDNIDSDSDSSFGQRIQISDRNAIYDNEEEEKTNDGDFGTSKERKSGKVNPAPGATVAKCDAQILKMNEHIYSTHTILTKKATNPLGRCDLSLDVNHENKTAVLGTSKINYLDPRTSVVWCRKHDVPLDKIFSPKRQDKVK